MFQFSLNTWNKERENRPSNCRDRESKTFGAATASSCCRYVRAWYPGNDPLTIFVDWRTKPHWTRFYCYEASQRIKTTVECSQATFPQTTTAPASATLRPSDPLPRIEQTPAPSYCTRLEHQILLRFPLAQSELEEGNSDDLP